MARIVDYAGVSRYRRVTLGGTRRRPYMRSKRLVSPRTPLHLFGTFCAEQTSRFRLTLERSHERIRIARNDGMDRQHMDHECSIERKA